MQWELLFIFLKPQSVIDFGETNGQVNCSVHNDFEFFGRKTECIQSHHKKTAYHQQMSQFFDFVHRDFPKPLDSICSIFMLFL